MSSYTISPDRKTITISLDNPIPGQASDDACIHVNIEQATGAMATRYISPDVVGVIRAFMATQTTNSAPTYPNVEALIFATVEGVFVANIDKQYPASVAPNLAAVASAQQALQLSIQAVIAEQVIL